MDITPDREIDVLSHTNPDREGYIQIHDKSGT